MATTRTILALETNATTLAHFLPFEIVVLHTFNARSERQSAKNTCGTCILWHGCHHKITHTEVLVVHTEDMRISYTIFAENPKQNISLNLEADGRIIFNGSQDIEWTSIMGSFASKQPYSMHAGNKKKKSTALLQTKYVSDKHSSFNRSNVNRMDYELYDNQYVEVIQEHQVDYFFIETWPPSLKVYFCPLTVCIAGLSGRAV